MKLFFDFNSQPFSIDLTPQGKAYRATVGDETVDVEILHVEAEQGKLELLINGERVVAYVSADRAKRWVTINGQTQVLTKASGARSRGKSSSHDQRSELAAPMPGVVRSVNVEQGQTASKGQTLMVLEAMKMEIRIHAPRECMIRNLLVKQGQTVERDQVLIEIE